MLQARRTEELQECYLTLQSLLGKYERSLNGFSRGTSQHNLISRRIQALKVALSLITGNLHGETSGK